MMLSTLPQSQTPHKEIFSNDIPINGFHQQQHQQLEQQSDNPVNLSSTKLVVEEQQPQQDGAETAAAEAFECVTSYCLSTKPENNNVEYRESVSSTRYNIPALFPHQHPLISSPTSSVSTSGQTKSSAGELEVSKREESTMRTAVQLTTTKPFYELLSQMRRHSVRTKLLKAAYAWLPSSVSKMCLMLQQLLVLSSSPLSLSCPPSSAHQLLFEASISQHFENDYEEFWIRSPVTHTERPSELVYMVPGNPGVVKAYIHFMTVFCKRHDYDGCVVSHLGHCTFSRRVYTMKEQVEHHLGILKKHLGTYHKVLLLGHSIGGYIIMEMCDFLMDMESHFSGIGLLMPALTKFPRMQYWALRTVSIESRFMAHVRRSLIWLNSPSELVNDLITDPFSSNILSLIRDSLATFTDDIPRAKLAFWGLERKKLFIIFSKRDPYMSRAVQRTIHCCTEPLKSSKWSVLSLYTIDHCFVLSPEESVLVSDLITHWITTAAEDLPSKSQLPPSV